MADALPTFVELFNWAIDCPAMPLRATVFFGGSCADFGGYIWAFSTRFMRLGSDSDAVTKKVSKAVSDDDATCKGNITHLAVVFPA
jgi:hypothetical protein